MSNNEIVKDSIKHFLRNFEVVFHNDWEMTKTCLENSKYLIDENGTFLEPMVEDEANNWGNRGALLESYRNLCKALDDAGISRESLGPNS